MNTKNFLNNENVKVLWDVVIDEDIIKRQSREFHENILNLFRSNLKGFYDVESQKTTNLVDMNKKYILLILNHANKQIAQIAQNVKPEYRKNKILDELPQKKVNELITYEEIHNDKRSQFDKDLTKRQEEFTNAMALPVPPVPKFSDNLEDGPISEIEKAIKELTSQRNYDVEQINKSNNNSLSSNTDNWLKPQETSVKNDKLSPQPQNIQNGNINGNNSRLKYLKIDNENIENQVISLDREKQISPKKNVTWDLKPYNYSTEIKDELLNEVKLTMEEISENETDNNEEDANIFKLLKKVPLVKDTNDNKISVLQAEVKTLNSKLDLILELLKNKN
jgi:hypothetical protein